MTAVPGKRRQIMKDNLIGKDQESVWSKIASEMQEDEKTRALLMPQKMERRKAIESEYRYRRGVYKTSEMGRHPTAMKQQQLDAMGEHNASFPWETRDESINQFKKIVTRKIN
mgnify:CR=1 FL=1|jgi:hypothetical protein